MKKEKRSTKMKKFVKSVLALAMVVVLSIGMTGCAKISKLLPETTGTYSFSIDDFYCLSSTKAYSTVSQNGKYAVLRESDGNDGKYIVIDVEKDEIVCSSKNPITIIDNGLFAWYDQSEEKYFVHANDNISVYNEGSINDLAHTFVDAATLARTYVDFNGNVKTETNPFAKILTYSDDYEKMGDNYVKEVDDGVFDVFNKDGKYVRTVKINELFGWSQDEMAIYSWSIDDTMFIQTIRVLADDAKDYDFVSEGKKYDFTTYTYNVSKNKVKVLNDFNYMVRGLQYSKDEMAVLTVQKIENKKVDNVAFAQSFEENGDIYIDLQDIVPGAKQFSVIDGKYSKIVDAVGDVHVFKENEKLAVIPAQQVEGMNFVGSYAYRRAGSQLYLFDLENGAAMSRVEDVQSVGRFDTKIIYVQKNENVNKICVFDAKTKNTKTYALDEKENAVLNGDYVMVREENAFKKVVFCADEDFVVEEANGFSVVGFAYDRGVNYKVCMFIEGDNNAYYKVLKYTYPVENR